MGLWRTFKVAMGFVEPETPRTLPTDPVQLAYEDALELLDAMYTGQPWGRAWWLAQIGQTRWERATDLLRAANIVDKRGRCLLPIGYAQQDAEVLVREALYQQKRGRFVRPR